MRKKRAVLKNSAASKTAIKTSVEDLSEIETKRKRVAPPAEPENKIESDNESANGIVKNLVSVSSSKNFIDDDESSDSSSNEFTRPDINLMEIEDIGPKEEGCDDFAAIEDNILGDVGRLSESDESDFEEVLPVPSPVKEGGKKSSSLEKKETRSSPPKQKIREDNDAKVKRERKSARPREKKNTKSAPKVTAKKVGSKRGRRKTSAKEEEDDKKPIFDVNKMDVSELLALGESVAEICNDNPAPIYADSQGSSEDEESEEQDWEEVDAEVKQEEKPHAIPKEGVQITIEAPDLFYKKKKKGIDLEACLKRRLNRNKRHVQVLIHKVHILCWIAHGRYVNYILNSEKLMGLGLSLIPSKHCYPPNRTDLDYLEKIVQWFKKAIPIVPPDKSESNLSLEASLERQFQSRKARSKKELVLMFVCMIRSLGIKARLVLSLQPAPLKPPSHELCSIAPKNPAKVKPTKSTESKVLSPISEDLPSTSKVSETSEKSKTKMVKETKKVTTGKSVNSTKKDVVPAKKTNPKTEAKSQKDVDKPSSVKKEDKSAPKTSRSQRCKKKLHYKDSDSSDFEEVPKSKDKRDKKSPKGKANTSKKSPVGKRPSTEDKKDGPSEEDSDFEPQVLSIRKGKGIKVDAKDRKIFSSTSESEGQGEGAKTPKKKEGVDVWSEVYLEMEEKWISVDVPQGKIHCVVELHAKATSPVLYVLAFANDLSLKDVSRRYCPQWLSVTQKKRVDERWWKRSLRSFLPRRDAFDRREEEEMDEELESRPLPTSITEYKNHPMYALRRHLLKFEAIYPPDSPSLGFIRGEPVFPRECVQQLHSRETWLKEAKVVRLGEKPYKIVKARPKYDRMSGKVVTDLPLELFGMWQVDDYIPPPAFDGKVPRNEYGNVDLYKPCMLPAGTVHLRLPALNRVAKKLQIDCAPAVTGFDFHSGGCHPTFDGFIVCEEFKETLIEAWAQEQDEQEKRHKEKQEKRVLGNWVRLVRGLLIRESLRHKYSFGEEGESSSGKKKTNKKKA